MVWNASKPISNKPIKEGAPAIRDNNAAIADALSRYLLFPGSLGVDAGTPLNGSARAFYQGSGEPIEVSATGPLVNGMLWGLDGLLRLYDGAQWNAIASLAQGATKPVHAYTGALWQDPTTKDPYYFNGSTWELLRAQWKQSPAVVFATTTAATNLTSGWGDITGLTAQIVIPATGTWDIVAQASIPVWVKDSSNVAFAIRIFDGTSYANYSVVMLSTSGGVSCVMNASLLHAFVGVANSKTYTINVQGIYSAGAGGTVNTTYSPATSANLILTPNYRGD